MNVELLRRVAKHISEEPRRFIMGSFIERQCGSTQSVRESAHRGSAAEHPFAACGTAACIAGWAQLLTQGMDAATNPARAAKFLGLDGHWSDSNSEANRLFEIRSWPRRFKERYNKAQTPKTRVKIAVERIEHFIKTKGKE